MNGWPAPEPVEASSTTLTIKVLKERCWGIIQFGDPRYANQAIQEGVSLRGPWCEPNCMTQAVVLYSVQDATFSDTSRQCAPHQLLARSARRPTETSNARVERIPPSTNALATTNLAPRMTANNTREAARRSAIFMVGTRHLRAPSPADPSASGDTVEEDTDTALPVRPVL
jgi:hypothetical protein